MGLIEKKLYKMNPVYLTKYEEFIRDHSQYGGGSNDEKYRQAKTFSNVYELYIYAFFTGLRRSARVTIYPEDNSKTFWEIENWKPRDLVDWLIACALAESSVDMNRLEIENESNVSKELTKLKTTIEEYANGGLAYLSGLFENDPDLIEDDMLFIKLLSSE